MRAGRVIASVVLVRVASAADVVIVGAGQAGMAAAHLLASEGHTVHVLEATDHVGGRTRNIDAHTYKFDVVNDDALELGGTWFSPNHTAALKLCHELGVEVYNASFFDRFSHEHHGTKAPVEEWPWWFWGSDYPLEQQGHLNSTVFHTSKGVFRFRETQGLLTALPQDVLDELNQAGRFLTRAVSQLSNRCWAAPFVDNTWRRWDVDTTFGILRSRFSTKKASKCSGIAFTTKMQKNLKKFHFFIIFCPSKAVSVQGQIVSFVSVVEPRQFHMPLRLVFQRMLHSMHLFNLSGLVMAMSR